MRFSIGFQQMSLFVLLLVMGCASTTYRHNPGDHDQGFRFYRPKPFLLLQPLEGSDDPSTMKMELKWLPDFSQQASVHIRAGVGTNKTQIDLKEGWMLTKSNVELDSKIDEFMGALSKLIGTTPLLTKGLTGGGGGIKDEMFTPRAIQVCVSDVPIVYYESVINEGPDGKRRLYGWRYVGFAPFGACPVDQGGVECADCSSIELYGLVNYNGKMYFRKLSDLADVPNRIDIKTP